MTEETPNTRRDLPNLPPLCWRAGLLGIEFLDMLQRLR